MLEQFVAFLRERKDRIVRDVNVLESNWSPTYGPGEPRSVTIEVIDFDSLLHEMDEFSKQFKQD